MKIFLSWSGLRSRAVAEALNDWLRRVIQAVKPFYSPDIEKGAKWSSEIDDALEGTHFGIVCLTPDNLSSEWIHFETGALSKTKDALVWTFLHGLTPGDVPPPLGKFQHTVAVKGDVLQLLRTINSRLTDVGTEPLQDKLLEENFEFFWPRLEEALSNAEKIPAQLTSEKPKPISEPQRDNRELLAEILELARNQERRLLSFEEQLSSIQREAITSPILRPKSTGSSISITLRNDANVDLEFFQNLFDFVHPDSKVLLNEGDTGKEIIVTFSSLLTVPEIKECIDQVTRLSGIEIKQWKRIRR